MRDCPGTAAPRELAFFWQQKKARKENCRCFDGVRGCERGATVEQSETGVVSNACPCGASNRTSRPALLAGGARCAPPSAPNPRCRKQQSVGAGHARPAALRQLPVSLCAPLVCYIVGRGLDPSATCRQRFIRRGGIHPSRAVRLAAHLCGASGTPPPTIIAINLPVVCRGRIYAARQPAATSRFPIAAL